jgi:hypothetical protein
MVASRALAAGALALAALGALAGCSDSDPPPPTAPDRVDVTVVISEPVVRAGATSGLAYARSAAGAAAAGEAYVSLPPGSAPGATSAVIRNRATGTSRATPMVDGGFDPVGIAASVDDELVIEVRSPAGVLALLNEKVPPKRGTPSPRS